MAGSATSVEGVLTDFLTPLPPKIAKEWTNEALIERHRLLSLNAASTASNLGGVRYGHLALTMSADDYLSNMGHTFLPPKIWAINQPTQAQHKDKPLDL